MSARFSAKDVLDFLDRCVVDNPIWFFMDLEHGYLHTANSRLTLYADDDRWAIVFEVNGYDNRALCIMLDLIFFGNCLQNLERGGADDRYTHNAKFLVLVERDALQEISSEFGQVSPEATSVKLCVGPARRSADDTVAVVGRVPTRRMQIPSLREHYAKWVPDIHIDEAFRTRPTWEDLGRYLAFEYADLCRATNAEKRLCVPADLPEIMTVEAWHHRSYSYYRNGSDEAVMGDPPSSYETFPLLAEVLVTGDPSRFRPTLPPNNHWSNWPQAGSL